MEKMKKSQGFEWAIMLLLTAAFCYLLYLAFPGVVGMVSSVLLLLVVILCLFIDRRAGIPRYLQENPMPLLLYVSLFLGGVFLIFVERALLLLDILFALAGLVGIIQWIAEGRYKNMTIGEFFWKECHILSPEVDVATIAVWILSSWTRHEPLSTAGRIFIIILAADFVWNLVARKEKKTSE